MQPGATSCLRSCSGSSAAVLLVRLKRIVSMVNNAQVDEAKQLICEMCHNFYMQGWVGGTGGGMSIKTDNHIVMAPSGVQKERMIPADMYVLDHQGNVVETPTARPAPNKPPKLSECSPLFMAAYELRGAGAVVHSHSLNALLATLIDPTATEFNVTNLEMIKGIAGHGYYDNCVVPIIENTARESELTERLSEAIKAYPKSQAVLVRRHGVYVWGSSWVQAKTQSECYDYLFECAIRMKAMGIDAAKPAPQTLGSIANGQHAVNNGTDAKTCISDGHADGAPAAKRHKSTQQAASQFVVLDIEGTVAPISFVYDVMFPYVTSHLQEYLDRTWDTAQTQAEVKELLAEVQITGAPGVKSKAFMLLTAVKEVNKLMKEDKKVTILKTLQGHIWEEGFAKGDLKAELYEDVQPALASWASKGLKTYIYSSGSRQAQKNLFAHTKSGDMRPLLSGFFDTTSGLKLEATSYDNIALSLGVDNPSQIMFATDNIAEAEAASKAGWQVGLTVRPGNKPLPEHHEFRVIKSMQDLVVPY